MLYSWGFIVRTILSSFRNMFNITGRLGRLSFIFSSLVMVSVFINLPPFFAMFGATPETILNIITLGWFIISCIFFLLAVQRIHDVGFSVAVLMIGFIPYVGFLAALLLLFLPGEDKPNRFGDVPESVSLQDLFPRTDNF